MYEGVFGVTENKFEVRIKELKIADAVRLETNLVST